MKKIIIDKSTICVDSFIPHFQPIFDAKTFNVVKYELLARFISLEGEAIAPANICDCMSDISFLSELFIRSVELIKHVHKNHLISINVDPSCLLNKQFETYIKSLSSDLKNQIEFEIVEINLINNFEQVVEFTNYIQKLGFHVSLDDFGFGFSNLHRLECIKFDSIKIDGYFIKQAALSPIGFAKLKSMIALLKHYDVPLVAEHIENQKILDIVQTLDIDLLQGYHLGTPRPIINPNLFLDEYLNLQIPSYL